MTNTELRDSIAKELFLNSMMTDETVSKTEVDEAGGIDNWRKEWRSDRAKVAFNAADSFMEEKLRREDRHYLGKVNDEEKS